MQSRVITRRTLQKIRDIKLKGAPCSHGGASHHLAVHCAVWAVWEYEQPIGSSHYFQTRKQKVC